MSDLLTLIAVAIGSPTVLVLVTWLTGRATKREEWARQDEIAKRVAEVARVAAENQVSTDQKLAQLGVVAEETHALVNSDMTAARKAELTSTLANLALLRRLVDPTPDDMHAVEVARDRITELQHILADRLDAAVEYGNHHTPPRGTPQT